MKKKLLTILLAIGLVAALGACSDGATENEETVENEVVTEETKGSDEDVAPGIKGSQAYDIIIDLDNNGIPKAETVNTSYGYQYDSMTSEYGYSITANSKHEIMCATFYLMNDDNSFMTHCATMPYDSADTEAASKWVEENIGSEAETTIGEAKFILYNGTNGPVLTIQDPGFDI